MLTAFQKCAVLVIEIDKCITEQCKAVPCIFQLIIAASLKFYREVALGKSAVVYDSLSLTPESAELRQPQLRSYVDSSCGQKEYNYDDRADKP